MDRPRMLIVEDHEIVIEALVKLLGRRYEIVGTLTDGRGVVEEVGRLCPDVLLLDLSIPHVSGLEVLQRLKARKIPFKAVVLTMHADPCLAVEALKMGASAFVLKESSGRELEEALQLVIAGRTYLSPQIIKPTVLLMVQGVVPGTTALTERQLDVLRLVVRGQRAKEIAAALSLTTRSVEAIKYRVMQQLQVRSTAELVRFAYEHRIVS
ncbi:MAG TPA: response regulator transcription factor [Vicinamibacterales bacterium]|nr:response regulator transcription factor [Vicinamibacterales bacterium]